MRLDRRSNWFCNRQQHNYFVLLFVSFCTKKKKKERKKGKNVDVFRVFLVPGGLGSKRSSGFEGLPCPRAANKVPLSVGGLNLPGSCPREPEARGAWRRRVGRVLSRGIHLCSNLS